LGGGVTRTSELLVIDGSHGEGGGQIVRTAVSLAAVTGRRVRIDRIRAARRKPGLRPQHVTAVRAAAATCDAMVDGDEVGSSTLGFSPRRPPRAGSYEFDVAAARAGGSAGAATLVLQTVLLPLAFADGASTVALRGGTHVPLSPPADYVRDVWAAALRRLGVLVTVEISRPGWFPAGGGAIRATVVGTGDEVPRPLELHEPGPLRRVVGRALASRLPDHVPRRMAQRATAALRASGIEGGVDSACADAVCPGAGIFLTAEYEKCRAGFGALGARGRPAEDVADEAVAALLAHRASGAALDGHLGDQILPVLARARGSSTFTVERASRHLLTNAWVVGAFGLARIDVRGATQGAATVDVSPTPSA